MGSHDQHHLKKDQSQGIVQGRDEKGDPIVRFDLSFAIVLPAIECELIEFDPMHDGLNSNRIGHRVTYYHAGKELEKRQVEETELGGFFQMRNTYVRQH